MRRLTDGGGRVGTVPAGAPLKKGDEGVPYAGDAQFGPINPVGGEGDDLRLEQSDFLDCLGIPYTFRNGVTRRPDQAR